MKDRETWKHAAESMGLHRVSHDLVLNNNSNVKHLTYHFNCILCGYSISDIAVHWLIKSLEVSHDDQDCLLTPKNPKNSGSMSCLGSAFHCVRLEAVSCVLAFCKVS